MTSAKAPFCSDYSMTAGEQLFGTAKAVDVWLLIEHRERWERAAVSMLPEIVRKHIGHLEASIPRMRTALIRQPRRRSGPLAAFVAFTTETDPRLLHFELTSIEELRAIDFQSFSRPSNGQSLFAVCTHGTHDLCCSRYGNAVYEAMNRLDHDHVWQVSHIGGCRFAPNVLCLPHGLVYGRLEPDEVAQVIRSHEKGMIHLPRLRGKSSYAKPVQAADYFLRLGRQMLGINDLALFESGQVSPGHWRVVFRSTRSADHYEVLLSIEESMATYKSCSTLELLARERFRLIEKHHGM